MKRIGLIYGPLVPYDDVVYGARLAEQIGLESVWVSEAWGADGFVVATNLASITERVRIGLGIVNVYSRTPSAIAMGISTLDMISKGRAMLGLGVSSPPLIEDWHGLKFGKPFRRVREYSEIVRKVSSGSRVDYDGELFKLKRFKLAFKPFRSNIPIYIAGLGYKMIRLAGEVGDGVLLFLHPKERIPNAVMEIEKGASSAGRIVSDVDVACIVTCYASNDREEARRRAKKAIAQYVGGMGPFYSRHLASHGFGRETSLITEAWRQGKRDDAHTHVSEQMVDSLCLAGSIEECRDRLEEYFSLGIKLLILGFPVGEPDMKRWVDEVARLI